MSCRITVYSWQTRFGTTYVCISLAGSGAPRWAVADVQRGCRITAVDGLKGGNPPPNTTVYLTLSCPNSNN